jgi:ATP-dependent Clp protease, protease subunit
MNMQLRPASLPSTDCLFSPSIRLMGAVDDRMLGSFLTQMNDALQQPGPITLEMMTTGGDADTGRRLALEIELCRELKQRDIFFLGKTCVYSAGVTLMASFPRERRFLARDTMLLIHGRSLDKEVHYHGPLKASSQIAKELLAQLETGRLLEAEGFQKLIVGSKVSLEEVVRRSETNWYLTASEALELGLIANTF